MSSELQARKIDRHFDLFDQNGDGVLEYYDYIALAQRLIDTYREPPRSPEARAIVDGYDALWRLHVGEFDTDSDQCIDRAGFRSAMAGNMLHGKGFNEIQLPLLQAILAITDPVERGALNRAEFTRLMTIFKVSVEDSYMTFADLDADGDERLTHEDFIRAVRDFYCGQDPHSPATRLFGWLDLG